MAITLILLVRTTGVLNFAAADAGMFCAFIAFAAITQFHLPVTAAVALTAVSAAFLGAVTYASIILIRPADPLMLSLRTLSLFILARALAYKFWGANSPYRFPRIVPDGSILVLGVAINYTQLAVIGIALMAALGVSWLTSRTRIGLMLRAVSSDRDTAADLGVAVIRVDLVAWCTATLVAGVVGVLVAQLTFLSPDMMSPVLLAGFAAAQLADMQSMRTALIAGVLLGITQSASSVYLNQPEWSQVLSFALLAGGLLLRGQLRRRVVAT
ncbi:MAG: branched-chain amino acid ABC transporter permease [Hyphomicrobiales bacterium]|nr:branched-chain amino acid ABC transporter permease [Hyphomicrobiales bacterium]